MNRPLYVGLILLALLVVTIVAVARISGDGLY